MRNILVFGSSHIGCLSGAYHAKSTAEGGRGFVNSYTFKPVMEYKQNSRLIEPEDGGYDNYSLNKDVENFFIALENIDSVILSISGSDYLPYGIANSQIKYDFLIPDWDIPPRHDARLIIYAEVEEAIRQTIRHVLLGIREIRRLRPDIEFYYLEPPPPIGNNDFILNNLTWEKGLVAATGLSDPVLRLKLAIVHNSLIMRECRNENVSYITLPPCCKDEQGFMHESGYFNDLMHANQWFGEKVLHHIDESI